ncbi:MAG: helix-turn-helix transcriptional regulator [Agitococcus sp.]|jgi:transcriptional regulator with XRE-family HTH domain|nr:helix-turn-helix transcriptional regulator [Agitococcus sp.]
MSLSNRLKELRLKKGKSLQEAADALGFSKAHLWELESGKSKNPSAELLKKLSDYFEVSIGWLLGEDESSTDDQKIKVLFRQLQELRQEDLDLIQAIINTRQSQGEKKV